MPRSGLPHPLFHLLATLDRVSDGLLDLLHFAASGLGVLLVAVGHFAASFGLAERCLLVGPLALLSPVENGGAFRGKMAVRGLGGLKGEAPGESGNGIGWQPLVA